MFTLSGTLFSCNIPDVDISTSDPLNIEITIDGETVYNELLYPLEGAISFKDLSGLVTPYAKARQTVTLTIKATSEDGTETKEMSAEVVYCTADFGDETPADFLANHFLSILMGSKVTAMGRLEYLHMQGGDTAVCTAYYGDGTTQTHDVITVAGGTHYKTLDVSPENYAVEGKTLISYAITAGGRTQEYEIDLDCPDCAPILIFVNAFGMDELAYCTGIHKVAPSYKRSTAYIGRTQKSYKIDETRSFKADTGPLTMAMANWWDEVFRSDSVRIVNFYDGNPNVGKDVLITESKSEYSNDDAEMPRFTFTYQYAQYNHNVVDLLRAGRIFDNTFDNTFN